ncbi:Hypothetical predicted protein, partial [Paramuricea clavata]
MSSPDHVDLTAITDKLEKSVIKPWLEVQSDHPRLQAGNTYLRIPAPLPSIGQIKTVLKHSNPRKANGADDIAAWCLKRYAEELAPVVHDIAVAVGSGL